ncbi:MAG: winged helix-turn-helix transcriptional regulator [Candidatus Thorarchaeota archaeon]
MTLSELDLRLLKIIELSPTISIRELAVKANTSWVTVNKHITKLKIERVLSNPIAVFDPSSLGLERHVILFRVNNESQLENLELACDIHPYTHYRSRIYGPFIGLFAQFDIPPKGQRYLKKFLKQLEDEEITSKVTRWKCNGYRRSTNTNLDLYDSGSMSWNYNWNDWIKNIESASSELPQETERRKLEGPIPPKMDLEILRELTANANISQSELMKKFSLSQSSISRKMIFIKENLIESIRAQIDRSRFDITSTKLFYCHNASLQDRAKLYNAFNSKSVPPFPLSINLLEDKGLLLWGRMPPSYEHNLFYALWTRLPDLQVFTMDTVRNHSQLYWFYPENVDEDGHWKVDADWILDTPFRELQNKITEAQ